MSEKSKEPDLPANSEFLEAFRVDGGAVVPDADDDDSILAPGQ